MIECAVHLLSRLIFGNMPIASLSNVGCALEALGTGYFTRNVFDQCCAVLA